MSTPITSSFESDLPPVQANHEALTPIHFLGHTAGIYPDQTAVIHGELSYDYATLHRRCRQLASALTAMGIGSGNTVSIIAPNIPAHLEAHFGVPMTGAVLNSINVRLDPDTIQAVPADGETIISTGKIQKFLLRERAREIA